LYDGGQLQRRQKNVKKLFISQRSANARGSHTYPTRAGCAGPEYTSKWAPLSRVESYTAKPCQKAYIFIIFDAFFMFFSPRSGDWSFKGIFA
jgi:hypothetical protein